MTRLRVAAGGALVIAAASVAAWSLAYPQTSLADTLARAVADCAGVVTLGLAVVPALDVDRYRGELARRASVPLLVGSAVWLVAELVRLTVAAAQAAAVPAGRLAVPTAVEFALYTTAGRCGLAAAAAAAVVCVVTAAAPRTAPLTGWPVTAGVAASGLLARTLAGHLAASPLGGVAVSVHALAAALWCGSLAALALTVHHRGQWARVLPRFSRLALGCVVALVAAGLAGAAVRLDSPLQLLSTGYGRLLAAKLVVTVLLVLLAARNRSWWLPAARSHRAGAGLSQSRALAELTLMTVALVLAAGLAVTG